MGSHRIPTAQPALAYGEGESEAGLVSRLRAGDAGAFECVFHAYWGPLCDYAYANLRSRDLVEEIVQDVFLRLWDQRGASWPVRGSLRSYLFAATRYGVLNTVRRERVETRWAAELAREIGNAHSDPTTERRTQIEAAVSRAIAQQPPRRAEVLRLRWVSELSYAEIAETLGISVKTVENQLARGLQELRTALEPYRQL